MEVVCHAEQGEGLKGQQEDSRHNAVQSPSIAQPVIQYAFNPDAPEFVSSKPLQRTNAQTCSSQSSPKPLDSVSTALQAKGSLLDRHSTTSEPASPKIPAMNSGQRASSLQETQEASVRPSSIKDSVKAAVSSTSALEHSFSASPHSGADSTAHGQSIEAQSARGSWLTVGMGALTNAQLSRPHALNRRSSCACADAVRAAEETACIRQEAELQEQRLLGSDFSISRRVQVQSACHLTATLVKLLVEFLVNFSQPPAAFDSPIVLYDTAFYSSHCCAVNVL